MPMVWDGEMRFTLSAKKPMACLVGCNFRLAGLRSARNLRSQATKSRVKWVSPLPSAARLTSQCRGEGSDPFRPVYGGELALRGDRPMATLPAPATIIGGPVSPYVRKVLAICEIKGVPYLV